MAEDAEIVIAAAIKEVEDVIIAETEEEAEATVARTVVSSLFLKKHLFLLDLLP